MHAVPRPGRRPRDVRLAAIGEDPVERIVSSPLSRALLVAQAVARSTGAPLHTDDRLFLTQAGLKEVDPLRYRPGGGESVEQVLRRVRRAWTGIASSEANTLVVTHAGPIRCLLHIGRGVPILQAIEAGIAYGSVERFAA